MKKALKILAGILVAIIVIGAFVFLYNKSKTIVPNAVIEEVTIVDSIESTAVITGQIEPRNEILIKPQMNGIVSEILHKAGDIVETGEVIAKLSVVPDMMQVNNTTAQLDVAKVAFQNAKEVYLRDKDLHDKGVLSTEEFQQSEAVYKQKKIDLETAKDALEIVLTGVSKRTAKTSTTLVRSTTSGKILDIPVKVGNSVIQANTFNEGTTIATVANMKDLIFTGKVDESEVGKIHVGQEMTITIGAMNQKSFPATVEFISPKGTITNDATTFELKAALKVGDNNDIRAGYSANAKVILERADKVPAIPETCVEYDGDKTFVQLVIDDSDPKNIKTERKQVKLGVSDGVHIQVLSGLKKGDRLKSNLTEDN